jgi:hypothetical protein
VRSRDAVRSAVRELKSKLCQARMQKLASAIRGQGRHYRLILHRSSSPKRSHRNLTEISTRIAQRPEIMRPRIALASLCHRPARCP